MKDETPICDARVKSYGRLSRRRFLRMTTGAALGAAGLTALRPNLVYAASCATYLTTGPTPVRNGPSIFSTIVANLGANSPVTVGSQTGGSKLASGQSPNNGTWNRLTNGNWIHDHYLNTPANGPVLNFNDGSGGYALFSGAVLSRTTPSVLGRSSRNAVAWWAETQMGVTDYVLYCLGFAYDAWRLGANITPQYTAPTAIQVWNAIPQSARGGGVPPEGAIVFWSWLNEGHAAISAGNNNVVSTYFGGSQTISWATVDQVSRTLPGKFLGWWLPA